MPRPKHSSTFDRRALEEIKLRAPIEEVVLERVPELKRSGALLVACCPFHDEKTPSFKVDPRRGTWHCYGACARGGDQISFVMEFDRVDFRDALEILAAKTGVELRPADPRETRAREQDDAAREVLKRAERFFRRRLSGDEGRAAREYLSERDLTEDVVEAFGLGWAPAGGTVLVDEAARSGLDRALLEETGLARRNDRGRLYDFFRGRLIIPIRDERGRTVGFGARRLGDGADAGPKYVNTPETRLFHKGRLIYGLDLALESARRSGHLVLVEGYTDVMAAHRAGLHHVGAVLGTSTTEDHAGLVRRAGARRVSLVFDGDEAGERAARRALNGLLPLGIDLRVATLPEGVDPCDLLSARDGDFTRAREEFERTLDEAPDWFEFLTRPLKELRGQELSDHVDEVLELLLRLDKPVHRDARLAELAALLNLPLASLREQFHDLPARRRSERLRRESPSGSSDAGTRPRPEPESSHPRPQSAPRTERRVRQAFGSLLGAVLLDNSLVPRVREWAEDCPAPELEPVLTAVLELYDRDDTSEIDASAVITHLGDHPLRESVTRMEAHARIAESIEDLFESNVRFLLERRRQREMELLLRQVEEIEATSAETAAQLAERARLVRARTDTRTERPHVHPHETPST